MALTSARLRIILRWLHIVLGLILMCYIYSPFHKYIWFQLVTKFCVIPIITLSGIWVWKFKKINKLFGIK